MLRIICSSVFLIMAFMTLGIADEHFPFIGEVVKESVNVRAGANVNFEKVDKLSRGDEVVVLGHTYEWYKIQLPITARAYIRADYVQMKDGMAGQVTADKVNVRAMANSDSASLGQLAKGSVIKVVEQVNGWCRIEPTFGIVAWVNHDFISIKADRVAESRIYKPLSYDAPVMKKEGIRSVQGTAGIKVKGILMALEQPLSNGVRYQLIIDGKPVYFLQEGPKIGSFVKSTVEVDGVLIADQGHQYPYPVIHINKITLVL